MRGGPGQSVFALNPHRMTAAESAAMVLFITSLFRLLLMYGTFYRKVLARSIDAGPTPGCGRSPLRASPLFSVGVQTKTRHD